VYSMEMVFDLWVFDLWSLVLGLWSWVEISRIGLLGRKPNSTVARAKRQDDALKQPYNRIQA
ncbi:MAG TPA: hypothetical protein VFD63_06950, partial [Pyrinomonadaceae bacterium]|nr:hypothetical protein [Pyrinomonadaceae bacterium]